MLVLSLLLLSCVFCTSTINDDGVISQSDFGVSSAFYKLVIDASAGCGDKRQQAGPTYFKGSFGVNLLAKDLRKINHVVFDSVNTYGFEWISQNYAIGKIKSGTFFFFITSDDVSFWPAEAQRCCRATARFTVTLGMQTSSFEVVDASATLTCGGLSVSRGCSYVATEHSCAKPFGTVKTTPAAPEDVPAVQAYGLNYAISGMCPMPYYMDIRHQVLRSTYRPLLSTIAVVTRRAPHRFDPFALLLLGAPRIAIDIVTSDRTEESVSLKLLFGGPGSSQPWPERERQCCSTISEIELRLWTFRYGSVWRNVEGRGDMYATCIPNHVEGYANQCKGQYYEYPYIWMCQTSSRLVYVIEPPSPTATAQT
ncbi:uncharacterized protein L969DRAFT_24953 [Mixia osmundae IAM 14324]|uniref:uncharacterized protein n=1 Tax=Mixia osmundae (strain CBS 9802 / IAM 14324 / JCM 22182 / KY 12970) TaxID=764103 RepID=UPI0004A54795|nr:uncharacterized protein L969DRAFT_24953 [Mixia osmundae IAM 14324]KEI38484.1 hypothetical protein L969DRAFT_24953 [Mixia osmundae IAM 14324]